MARRPSSVLDRLEDICITLEPLRGSAASLLKPVDINAQLDALAEACAELARRDELALRKTKKTVIEEAFELAHIMGWFKVNQQEKQLIELLRRTNWHGRNLVIDLAIRMRSVHPWVDGSPDNTKTTYAGRDWSFYYQDEEEKS